MAKSDLDNSSTIRDLNIFKDIRNYVRKKINNHNNEFSKGDFKPQWDELHDLLRRSIEDSESNSAVICGPPGCGKTALINNVLKELSSQGTVNSKASTVIKLNGLVHVDDRLALQAITKQMNISENNDFKIFKSFQENLMYLLEEIHEKKKIETQKPCVVFILDEFHLFCKHKNQILLYNLFDVVQSSKSAICVLGLTYYTDIMDLLEKRVLSRFSHRIIQMAQNVTLESRLQLFKETFTLHSDDLPNVEEIYKLVWNTRTDELMENKEVRNLLQQQLNVDPSQTKFRNLLFKLFSSVTFEQPLLTVENIKQIFTAQDLYVTMLSKLSLLEISLVIAIRHQHVNYEREPFNYEMIYTQYLKFAKRNATNLVIDRSVVLKAFQRLQELEIIIPLKKSIGNALGKVPAEYQLYNFNLTEDQVAEAVKVHKDLTAEIKQWSTESF